MRTTVVMLVMALGLVPAFGQAKRRAPAPAKPAAKGPTTVTQAPLRSIKIIGNRTFTAQQIIGSSGLKLETTVTQKDFDAARERLLATGVFDIVGYRYQPTADGRAYEATIEVTENPQLLDYRFAGLPADAKDLAAVIARAEPVFASKLPGSPPALDRVAAQLSEFLKARWSDTVIARVMPRESGGGGIEVVFRPATLEPMIAEIRFTGGAAIENTALQNAFNGIAIGVRYTEKAVRELLDSGIRPLYEARGRLRVAFPKVAAEKVKNIDGVALNITVEEGPEFTYGDLRVTGRGMPAKDALDLTDLRAGDKADFEAVKAGMAKITAALKRAGYMKAAADWTREIRDKTKTVDLTIRLEPGVPYVFGALAVVGLDVVSEPEIRKLWALKPGKAFNAEYPQFFLDQVRERSMFDNLGETAFDVKLNDDRQTVDVTLRFKGAPPKPPEKKRPEMP